jgi:hypothetical protein
MSTGWNQPVLELRHFFNCVESGVDREVHTTAGREAGATCVSATATLNQAEVHSLYQKGKMRQNCGY